MTAPDATRRPDPEGGGPARVGAAFEGLGGRGRAVAAVAALWAGLAVALGAFGAHGLEGRLDPERLGTFATAVRYQLWHALGALALLALGLPHRVALALLAGSAVFSGSLYLLVLTDTPWLGAVAPIGGALMIGGWGWAAVAILRR